MIVVRYADDIIAGFEHRHEAEQFTDKTRLIEFGRFAIANRRAQGRGKPESFTFLGFTHYCATRRNGSGFVLGENHGQAHANQASEIKEKLMATRHEGIDGQGRWLAQVLRGGWPITLSP